MNNYNELALTAQIKRFHDVVDYPGANNSTHRRLDVDFLVPKERPIGEHYQFNIVTMSLINKRIDDMYAKQMKEGDWVIVEFEIRSKESKGRMYTNINVTKISTTKI